MLEKGFVLSYIDNFGIVMDSSSNTRNVVLLEQAHGQAPDGEGFKVRIGSIWLLACRGNSRRIE